MDQHGLARADLIPLLGTPSRVSEVLRGKKGLSMAMVQRLRARFRVPADFRLPPPKKPPLGHRAAAVYTLIETCKMNDIDPQAWLADILARLPDHPANKVADLLPWNWRSARQQSAVAA